MFYKMKQAKISNRPFENIIKSFKYAKKTKSPKDLHSRMSALPPQPEVTMIPLADVSRASKTAQKRMLATFANTEAFAKHMMLAYVQIMG